MENRIRIIKKTVLGDVFIFDADVPFYGSRSSVRICRRNSVMTKDLIKLEMRCRALSFRPTKLGIFKLKSHEWHYRAMYTEAKSPNFIFCANPNRRKLGDIS